MSINEKEALMEEIAKMKPEDKAFVMGYCSARAMSEAEKNSEQKEMN